jgi:VCBS repeat-containing protein
MNTIQNLFQQAQLAEAAYANFINPVTGNVYSDNDSLTAALIAEGFGKDKNSNIQTQSTQAADFLANWRVVDQLPNTASGFSATVFQNVDTGQYVFAARGTETPILSNLPDWQADFVDIAGQGIALRQALDMYNYLQSLRTDSGGTYQAAYLKIAQTQTDELSMSDAQSYLGIKNSLEGAGYWVVDGKVYTIALGNSADVLTGDLIYGRRTQFVQLGNGYDAVGHSLGGHLAMILGRLDSTNVASVVTFNPPYFDPSTSDMLSNNFFSQLQELQLANSGGSSTIASSFDPNLNQSYDVSGDIVQNIGNLQRQRRSQTTIFSDTENTNPIYAHNIQDITDSLAVYSLFATIDPSLNNDSSDLSTIKNILEASSNLVGDTLESAISDLSKLLLFTPDALFTSNEFDNNRDLLYSAIDGIETGLKQLTAAGSLQLVSLVGKSAAELKVKAKGLVDPQNASAYRYALVNLNPFVITDSNGTLYGAHDLNGELDLYDPNATNPGTLTEQYLTDRAAMLAAVIQANTNDANVVIVNSGDSFTYQDITRIISLDVLNTANFGGILPTPQYKIIFGSDQADNLTGTSSNDRIYGMSGDDSLNGGAGSDYLEGGRGNDTYVGLNEHDTVLDVQGTDIYNLTGAAQATITDVGGEGSITWDGAVVNGGNLVLGNSSTGDAVWLSGDGQFSYVQNGADLLISKSGDEGYTTLTNFNFTDATSGPGSSDTLGISLTGAASDSGHALTNNDDTYTTALGETAVQGLGGNDILTVANGYAPGTTVFGGEGNDDIAVQDALDYFTAQLQGVTPPRPDPADQGAVLYGEGGNDFLQGGLKADTLIGGDGINSLFGYFGDDTLIGGPRTDILHGNDDTDFLIGGGGQDQLFGGVGVDTLLGGTGNDVLFGDAESVFQPFDPNAINETAAGFAGASNNYNRNLGAITLPNQGGDFYIISEAHGAAAGDDLLDGGAGQDYLNGGDGNDTLTGGGERDLLEGEQGDDTLYGGDGNDILYGDINPATYALDSELASSGDYNPADGSTRITLNKHVFNETTASIQAEFPGAVIQSDTADAITFLEPFDPGHYAFLPGLGNHWNQYLRRFPGGPGVAGNDKLYGGAGNDILHGGGGNDTLDGGADDDVLFGEDGNDTLTGGGGNDALAGGDGNDTYISDAGNDSITDSSGDDTYHYRAGWGDDLLRDRGGDDTLTFDQAFSAYTFRADGGTTLFISNGADVLEIGDWFAEGGPGQIEHLQFADGGKPAADINTIALKQTGTPADETYQGSDFFGDDVTGGGGNDLMSLGGGDDIGRGGSGNDIIDGGAGNDRLISGGGDDHLIGGAGADTYILDSGHVNIIDNASDGAINTVQLLPGLTAAGLTVARDGNDLTLTYAQGSVSIADYYTAPETWNVTTAAGTTIDPATLATPPVSDQAFVDNAWNIFYRRQSAQAGTRVAQLSRQESLHENRQLQLQSKVFAPNMDPGGGTAGSDTFVYYDSKGRPVVVSNSALNGVTYTVLDENTPLPPPGFPHPVRVNTPNFGGAGFDPSRHGVVNSVSYSVDPRTVNGGAGDDVWFQDNGALATPELQTLSVNQGHTRIGVGFNTVYAGDGNDVLGEGTRFQYGFNTWQFDFGLQTYVQFGELEPDLLYQEFFGFNPTPLLVDGGSGDDRLYGSPAEDFLRGGSGDDLLWGGNGNDTLAGEAGADFMAGGNGADTYLIGNHDGGVDYIRDYGRDVGVDTVSINTAFSGVTVTRLDFVDNSSDGLLLSWGPQGDRSGVAVELNNGSLPGNFGVERFQFTDGTYTQQQLLDLAVNDNDPGVMVPLGLPTGFNGYYANTISGTQLGDDVNLQRWVRDIDQTGLPTFINTGVGDDRVIGNFTNDNINAGAGNDHIEAGDGQDTLTGGTGDDWLDGGQGDDQYLIDEFDGNDTIVDAGGYDTLSLNNVRVNQISVSQVGQDLKIDTTNTDSVLIKDWYASSDNQIEQIYLQDASGNFLFLGATDLEAMATPGQNRAPVVLAGIPNQIITADAAFQFSLPANAFRDPDAGDSLTYMASVVDGRPLPSWLNIDPQTGAFSGVAPSMREVDEVTVTATDGFGESIGNSFTLITAAAGANVVNAPTFDGNPYDFFGTNADDVVIGSDIGVNLHGFPYDPNFTHDFIPADSNDILIGGSGNDFMQGGGGDDALFGGAGSDVLTGGISTFSNPGFDGNDTLNGGPGNDVYNFTGNFGHDQILDTSGNDQIFIHDNNLQVADLAVTRDGQNLVLNLDADRQITIDNWFTSDDNKIETVILFDTTTFDETDLTTADIEALLSTDNPPVLAQALTDQQVSEDSAFSFVIPNGTFVDPDAGDTLTYSAMLAGNNALPAWLTFDATTGTFSGAPPLDAAGDYGIVVTATDGGGLSATGSFTLAVQDVNPPITGDDNANVLIGTDFPETISGLGGDDVLQGNAGDDVLIGGGGDDLLEGGPGSDTYVFNLGDGVDTIIDTVTAAEPNVLQFGPGVTPDMVTLALGSLLIRVGGQGDAIHLQNFDPQDVLGTRSIDTFNFSDGSALSYDQLVQRGFDITGTDGNDSLTGTNLTDRINGGAGDDVLDGGQGDDVLNGGAGSDTYIFNLGGGNDTIQDNAGPGESNIMRFGAGISRDDLQFERNGDDLLIHVGNRGDTIHIPNFTAPAVDRPFPIGQFQFEGGGNFSYRDLTNHAPVTVADSSGVSEDDVLTATGNVLANDSDPDAGDVLSVSQPGVYTGAYGTLTLSGDGNYSYALDDNAASVQSLRGGQRVTDSFGYQASDGLTQTPGTLTVTITGANDAPVTVNDANSVSEDNVQIATGNVLANDSDADHNTVLTVTNAGSYNGAYGGLILNADGSYSYALNNAAVAVQSLAQRQAVTDVFNYSLKDDDAANPLTAAATLTLTITGANDAPVTVNDANAVSEDSVLTASGNVLANDSDIDQGTVLTVGNAGTYTGTYGTLTLNTNGGYSYAFNNAAVNVQSLRGGQQVTDSFDYQASDGIVQTPGLLAITITGANDAPVAVNDTNNVSEDNVLIATGNVLANDSDVDQGTVLSIANAGTYTGTYGTLALNVIGGYSYALNNTAASVQSLAQGETVTDTFNYSVRDDDVNPLSANAQLAVTITGSNDAPILVTPFLDQQAQAGQAFQYIVPAGAFTDIDHGDLLTYAAARADGSALPSWLAFNAATRTFSGTPAGADTGALQIRVTASDRLNASASDIYALTVIGSGGVTLIGTPGDDNLVGTAFNDTLSGGTGRDRLQGLGGDDVFNYGNDGTWPDGFAVRNIGSPGHPGTGEQASLTGKRRTFDVYDGGAGHDTLTGTAGNDILALDDGFSPRPNGTSGPRLISIEAINMGDGNDIVDLTSQLYSYGDVTIDGGNGNDILWTNAGNDVLRGGDGNDRLTGGAGDDLMQGGNDDDVISDMRGLGNDISQGGAGNDQIVDNAGQNLLDGGSGNDTLADDGGNSLLIGGAGNDTLTTGAGSDIIAYNKSDGRDTVVSGDGAHDTLSLGGALNYGDLTFSKSGHDLILDLGNNSRLTFRNWYIGDGHHSVAKLQVLTEGMAGYNPAGGNPLLDNKVETYDFQGLVNAFDTARNNNSHLSSWALTNALTQFHLTGSDTGALGGDLAYQYARQGTLAGIGLTATQDVIHSPQFGVSAQTLHPLSGLQTGMVRLA